MNPRLLIEEIAALGNQGHVSLVRKRVCGEDQVQHHVGIRRKLVLSDSILSTLNI